MADKRDAEELENEENWDLSAGERRQGVRGGRTVVSVSMSKDDFQRIARHAEREGMRTSEFIRQAAVDRVNAMESSVIFGASGGGGAIIFMSSSVPKTDVWGLVKIEPQGKPRAAGVA